MSVSVSASVSASDRIRLFQLPVKGYIHWYLITCVTCLVYKSIVLNSVIGVCGNVSTCSTSPVQQDGDQCKQWLGGFFEQETAVRQVLSNDCKIAHLIATWQHLSFGVGKQSSCSTCRPDRQRLWGRLCHSVIH